MTLAALLMLSLPGFLETGAGSPVHGTVRTADGSPVAGAVVFATPIKLSISIRNNEINRGEMLARTLSKRDGSFVIEVSEPEKRGLLVQTMEGTLGLLPRIGDPENAVVTLREPASIEGRLLEGPNPVAGEKLLAVLDSGIAGMRYEAVAKTGPQGQFVFDRLLPGAYSVIHTAEVPQIGCCFQAVLTHSAELRLGPGEKAPLQFGGTQHPFVSGHVRDEEGDPLHGVWVRLEPDPLPTNRNTPLWSTVTDQEGRYTLYDVPPGNYFLHCFRRLAENTGVRTFSAKHEVHVAAAAPKDPTIGLPRIEHNVEIDLQPFMPFTQGEEAPPITGALVSGAPFDPAHLQGKFVIIHFYAGWCVFCADSFDKYEALSGEPGLDNAAVVGVNLDPTLEDCKAFLAEHPTANPQIYGGPWHASELRKAFRIANIPAVVLISPGGEVLADHASPEGVAEFLVRQGAPGM